MHLNFPFTGANVFADSGTGIFAGHLPQLCLQRWGGNWVDGEESVPFLSAVLTEQRYGNWEDTGLGVRGVRSALT